MVVVDGKVQGCGVILLAGKHFLLGKRSDGQGWCLPGGKVDEGETFEQAALRELYEEATIEAKSLISIGVIEASSKIHGLMRSIHSEIYLSKDFNITADSLQVNSEMLDFKWVPLHMLGLILKSEVMSSPSTLFPPTKTSLQLFYKYSIVNGLIKESVDVGAL